jgi:hypothetical protein
MSEENVPHSHENCRLINVNTIKNNEQICNICQKCTSLTKATKFCTAAPNFFFVLSNEFVSRHPYIKGNVHPITDHKWPRGGVEV